MRTPNIAHLKYLLIKAIQIILIDNDANLLRDIGEVSVCKGLEASTIFPT